MIVLNTNIFSELGRKGPAEEFNRWSTRHGQELVITSITVGEVVRGIKSLRDSSRRSQIQNLMFWQLSNFERRNGVLPFDTDAAWIYGELSAELAASGRVKGDLDLMIAAICRSREVPLVTRNVKDFEGTGIDLINPWAPPR